MERVAQLVAPQQQGLVARACVACRELRALQAQAEAAPSHERPGLSAGLGAQPAAGAERDVEPQRLPQLLVGPQRERLRLVPGAEAVVLVGVGKREVRGRAQHPAQRRAGLELLALAEGAWSGYVRR